MIQESSVGLKMSSLFCITLSFMLICGTYAANCGEHSSVNGGDINYIQANLTNLYETGSTAVLLCQLGRIPTGNTISTCDSNGSWSPSLGSCPSTIGNLPCSAISVADGTVTYIQASAQSPYQPGTVALLSCNLGFLPTGTTSSTCDDGIWSPPLDLCKSIHQTDAESTISCSAHSPVANGQIVYLQSSLITTYAAGTTALLLCDLGFHPSAQVLSKCTSSGTWEPLGGCMRIGGSSEEVECPEFGSVENGQISYDLVNPRKLGTSALLLCNLGFLASGTTVVKCEEHGKWSDSLGTCSSISASTTVDSSGDCPTLSVDNGIISYDLLKPRMKGTTATLFCNPGYVLSGHAVSTCGDNCMWTPSIGQCQAVSQNSPSTVKECPSIGVQNGVVHYDFLNPRKSGTLATLACNLGYILEGSPLVVCNDDGSWNSSIGSCRSIFGR